MLGSYTAAGKQPWVSFGDLTYITVQLKQASKGNYCRFSGMPCWKLEENKTQQLTTHPTQLFLCAMRKSELHF